MRNTFENRDYLSKSVVRSLALPIVLAALLLALPFPAWAQGTITTIAGNGVQGSAGDDGQAEDASLNTPVAITAVQIS